MERITCEEGVSARYGGISALIIAAVIVAAAFTSIPALAPAVNGSTEQPITVQRVSGTVQISSNGGIEWTPLVPSDTISLGDTIMTGPNSVLLIQFSGGKIVLGQNTNVTYKDPHGLHHLLYLLFGKLWANIQSATGGSDNWDAEIGVTAVVGVRGTEFTAAAYENGTANVLVIEGLVEVQDLASNSTALLQANQTITDSGGLTQQDMSQAVETVSSTVAWWEESSIGPIATLAPSSTLSTTTLAEYVVVVVVVAVVVAGALVLYIRRRKVKH
jgi:hypothetical protein